ncbi:MAG: MazG nucleotide pyrophosphohydrolase domain-containing protein [Candidatus Diapherotrites archaeon]|nr:MazG nucleotide pyrophosphohydrolase domain-containing protein [Candidatus Diapherotrites archaeon]
MPGNKFEQLTKMMKRLRGKKGCPWDQEQTIESFSKHLEEEAEEVMHAVKTGDREELREELGDLLWNIVFICQIAQEQGLFDVKQVMEEVRQKIVRRHPHVFAGVKVKNSKEVMKLYKQIKKKEKADKKKIKKSRGE